MPLGPVGAGPAVTDLVGTTGTVARVSDVVPPKPGGKGRPTPKRSEAQKRRAATTRPPTSRKEALQQQKAARRAQRAALRTGDEKSLPAFARGPERAAVRDAVDSRLSLGWLAIPGLLLNVLSFAVRDDGLQRLLANVGFVMFMMLVADTVSAILRVRRVLAARFPNGTEARRGALIRYGVARNIALRRTRVPRPRVKVGEDVIGGAD